jgi:hypothetical protein
MGLSPTTGMVAAHAVAEQPVCLRFAIEQPIGIGFT